MNSIYDSPRDQEGGRVRTSPDRRQVRIMGLRIASLTEQEAVATVIDAAVERRGHWTITANLDHLRRYHCEPLARRLLESADTVVADGAPLVWASRIAGTPLPERVAGADMVWSISDAARRAGVSLYLLGGNPGVADHAAQVLRTCFPDLEICGTLCPRYGFDSDEQQLENIEEAVASASPGIIFVGLGFPKQDLLIERLRLIVPNASLIGIGIGLSYVAGDLRRSPAWTRALGLEWFHRLLHEPGRLIRRYMIHGIPFATVLLSSAVAHRVRTRLSIVSGHVPWGYD